MNDLDSINNIKVTFDDLWHVVETSNRLHEAFPRDFETLVLMIASLYKDDPLKANAVLCRMQALAQIIEEEGAPGWARAKQADGSVSTQESVFAAAAVQPLVEIDNSARFEKGAFLEKVLELAQSEGTA